MSTGRVAAVPDTPQTAAIAARQIGRDSRRVDEHKAEHVVKRLRIRPAAPRGGDVEEPQKIGV